MRTGRKLTRRERLLKIRARSTQKQRLPVLPEEVSSTFDSSTISQEKSVPDSPKSTELARDAIISRHILNRAARVDALSLADRSASAPPAPRKCYHSPPRSMHPKANYNAEKRLSSDTRKHPPGRLDGNKSAACIRRKNSDSVEDKSEPTGGSRVFSRVSFTNSSAIEADLAGGLTPLRMKRVAGSREGKDSMPYDAGQVDFLDEEREESAQQSPTTRSSGASINSPARYSPSRKQCRLQERRTGFRKPGLIASIDSTPPREQTRLKKEVSLGTVGPLALNDSKPRDSFLLRQRYVGEKAEIQAEPSIRPAAGSNGGSLKLPEPKFKQASVRETVASLPKPKPASCDSISISRSSAISFPSLDDEDMAELPAERSTCVSMAAASDSPKSKQASVRETVASLPKPKPASCDSISISSSSAISFPSLGGEDMADLPAERSACVSVAAVGNSQRSKQDLLAPTSKQSSARDTAASLPKPKPAFCDSISMASSSSISFPSSDGEDMADLPERGPCVSGVATSDPLRSEQDQVEHEIQKDQVEDKIQIHDASDQDWILGYHDHAVHIMIDDDPANSDQGAPSKNTIWAMAEGPLIDRPDIVATDDKVEVTFEEPDKVFDVAGSSTDSTAGESDDYDGYLSGYDGDWLDDYELMELGVEKHIGIANTMSNEISELSADFDSFTLDFSDVSDIEMKEQRENTIFCGCNC